MATPVNAEMIASWRADALDYLRGVMRDRAPERLGTHQVFDASPLEGEGPTVLFEFFLPSTTSAAERFFVAGGQTEPNYYPALDLGFEDAFALHLGTRFMLVLGVGVSAEVARPEIDVAKAVQTLVWSVRPGEAVSDIRLAAGFDVEGRFHGVAQCTVGNQKAYAFIGEAPPGFSTQVDHPPQVAYRIHLGRALLAGLVSGTGDSLEE